MPPPASQLILHQISRFSLWLPSFLPSPRPCPPPSLLLWASSVEAPAPTPRGHSLGYTQHRVVSTSAEEWLEVLWPQGPLILVLGSALRCETRPGHERTTSCHPCGSCDRWQVMTGSSSLPPSTELRAAAPNQEQDCLEKVTEENPCL